MGYSRPTSALRSPVGLSYAVVALLSFVIVTDLFSVFASVNLRGVVGPLPGDRFEVFADEDLEGADALIATAGGLQTIGLLATAALFIIWFHRVRLNAGVFAPDLQSRGAGWATGGWFIPIGNLWIPRGVAGDIWVASRQDPYGTLKKEKKEKGEKGESQAVLNAWWTAWILSQLINGVASRQYDDAKTAEALRTAANAFIVTDLVDIVAALLAILVVRRLTRMQSVKAVRGPQEVAV
ncbi:DUF4328 domain-containing protein [Streptomyces sp. NBC_01210]|uniref:DUF4328 domain-containing protein n=1 Tax=Streptomyces sp. NBC_01210 TaxID=2903774 RepID=UPI002E1399D9|nr:DUF4328 domain-containing protein [Streptomyces sp. NBC_01210]